MRILPGVASHQIGTASAAMLTRALATEPEIIYNLANLYEKHEAKFSSFLARLDLKARGLAADVKKDGYQVIGNRQVKWNLKGRSQRKGRIISNNSAGATPGLNHANFTLTVDTDWFLVNETVLCWDPRYVLFIKDKQRNSSGSWNYTVQMLTNNAADFVNPVLVAEGAELSSGYRAFPEFSEDVGERTTNDEWHTEFMTIQRFKWSTSGTAKAHKVMIEHNGKYLWTTKQQLQTMSELMRAREYQMLFGRATVDHTGKNIGVRDLEDREIFAGNGLFHQGDPSMKFTYSNITTRWLENLITSMQLSATAGMGGPEIIIGGGLNFINEFNRAMRGIFEQNPIVFAQGEGSEKGVNTTFSFYNFNDIKVIPMWIPAFDDPMAAQGRDEFGVSYRSRMGFALNTGANLAGQDPNVRLLALGNGDEDRRFIERDLPGLAGGGAINSKTGRIMAASAVDGYEVHMLCETGIALMNPLSFVEIVPAMRR